MQSGGTLGAPCLLTPLDSRAVLLQTCCKMAGCFGPCRDRNRISLIAHLFQAAPGLLSHTAVAVHCSLPHKAESAFHGEAHEGWPLQERTGGA